jgi:MFS transporter, UMF1 family
VSHDSSQGAGSSSGVGDSHSSAPIQTLRTANTRGSRREVVSWAMYDWANSAYSTILITVLMSYVLSIFPKADDNDASFPVVHIGSMPIEGAVVYAWGIGLSMFAAGLLSPITGAMADARANKRLWFRTTALAGAACGVSLGVIPPTYPWLIALMFVLTSFFFELSFGFYNAFLPEIADDDAMNRVSSQGFAAGYIGGGVALGLAFALVQFGDKIGLESTLTRVQVSLILMGIWWGIFSLPAIIILRDRAQPRSAKMPLRLATRQAVQEVKTTLTHLRSFRSLAWFLIGFLFYNDAVQTVLSQASVFGQDEIGLGLAELMPIILMIQFVSMPGALFVGWLADRIGQKEALYFCLAIWVGLLAFSWWVTSKTEFWIMGAVVALVMGGIQSVSRSIMGVMTPPDRAAEFFGFYNLSSKATSFIGPFTFGLVIWWTGSARLAILSLLLQLVVGWLLVSRVNVAQGSAEARREASTNPAGTRPAATEP